MGARIGSIVCSSGLTGKDPTTNALPDDPLREIELLFMNLLAFMGAAGGTVEHIVKMSVFLKDNAYRDYFNEQWLKMFPDKGNRPARHITLVDLPGGMHAQIEVTAVLE